MRWRRIFDLQVALMLVFGSGGCNALFYMALEGNEPAVRFWLELNADVNTKTWYTAHALANDERSKLNFLRVVKLCPLCHRLKLAPSGTAAQRSWRQLPRTTRLSYDCSSATMPV